MRSYEAARGLFSILAFGAWTLIAIGIIIAFLGGSAVTGSSFGGQINPIQFFLAAMPGLMLASVGVVSLAFVQMGRSGVDTAELTQQALDVSRQHLEISKQVLAAGRTAAASYTTLTPNQPDPSGANNREATANSGASYAGQPATSDALLSHGAPSVSHHAQATKDTLPSPETGQPRLSPPSHEIVYRDGRFTVGEEAFVRRSDAELHQRQLLSAHATDSTR